MENSETLTARLREMGFSTEEIGYYHKLSAAGECSRPERLRMMMEKRAKTLHTVHCLEKQIINMDTMKQEIRKKS